MLCNFAGKCKWVDTTEGQRLKALVWILALWKASWCIASQEGKLRRALLIGWGLQWTLYFTAAIPTHRKMEDWQRRLGRATGLEANTSAWWALQPHSLLQCRAEVLGNLMQQGSHQGRCFFTLARRLSVLCRGCWMFVRWCLQSPSVYGFAHHSLAFPTVPTGLPAEEAPPSLHHDWGHEWSLYSAHHRLAQHSFPQPHQDGYRSKASTVPLQRDRNSSTRLCSNNRSLLSS